MKTKTLFALACACALSANAGPILNVEFSQNENANFFDWHIAVENAPTGALIRYALDDWFFDEGTRTELRMAGFAQSFRFDSSPGDHFVFAVIDFGGTSETLSAPFTIAPPVPDAGSTSAMAAIGLAGLVAWKRRLSLN